MVQIKDVIVRVENLTAKYGDNIILNQINFEVYHGEVFAILGGSGCGKSTLLKHMIGLYSPANGKIYLDGEDIVGAMGKKRQKILRKIGVMYQSGALFGSMTLLKNVSLPMELFTKLPIEAIELIARFKLKLVGLDAFCHHFPSEISGGMQKRAAIARALALDPKIVFLDEPSAGLDPITSAELDQLILRLAASLKATFVIVSHELPSIYTIANRVIILDKNTKCIMATGSPQELRKNSHNPWVKKFFNRQAGNN